MSFQLKNASNVYKTYYEKDTLVFKVNKVQAVIEKDINDCENKR